MDKKANKPKILCVDDEPKVLSGLKLQLREHYAVSIATGGQEALDILRSKGPFSVIISDMRMPEMNGATFLSKAKQITPNTTRILLTGQSDIESAMAAVNQGQIFRFIMKPCPKEDLLSILRDAVDQYRLLHMEKELLEKTLQSSIQVLTDILSMVNPLAFSRSSRISRYIKHMAGKLELKSKWQFNIAAMLSQIGHITVPSDTLAKLDAQQEISEEESNLLDSSSKIAYELISKIPRLKTSAEMIQLHNKAYSEFPEEELATADTVNLGAQMLKLALDFDQKLVTGSSFHEALAYLNQQHGEYNPKLLAILQDIQNEKASEVRKTITVNELHNKMVIDQDIMANNGALLVSKGQAVTDAIRVQLQVVAKNGSLVDSSFRVIEYL